MTIDERAEKVINLIDWELVNKQGIQDSDISYLQEKFAQAMRDLLEEAEKAVIDEEIKYSKGFEHWKDYDDAVKVVCVNAIRQLKK